MQENNFPIQFRLVVETSLKDENTQYIANAYTDDRRAFMDFEPEEMEEGDPHWASTYPADDPKTAEEWGIETIKEYYPMAIIAPTVFK